MTFWVYILRCADNSYYTGHTDDLERRLSQHHAAFFPGCYTAKRRPLQLVFSEQFSTREEALSSEQRIKGWSRRKKEAMMRADWGEVSRLAISKSAPATPQTIQVESSQNPIDPVQAERSRSPAHPSTSLRANGFEGVEDD
jgi:putative endonuclease